MNVPRSLITFAGLSLLGAGLWLLLWWPPSGPPEATRGLTNSRPAPVRLEAGADKPVPLPTRLTTAEPAKQQAATREAPKRRAAAPELPRTPEMQLAPQTTGPVDELIGLFEREPRSSSAGEFETVIGRNFTPRAAPDWLLAPVECRTSVCRLRLRWELEGAWIYMDAMTLTFEQLGLRRLATLTDPPQADGSREVDIYMAAFEPIVLQSQPAQPQ